MPGTQIDAAQMIATAFALPNLPPYVMEALGKAGDIITKQQATIERLKEELIDQKELTYNLGNQCERLREVRQTAPRRMLPAVRSTPQSRRRTRPHWRTGDDSRTAHEE